MLGVEGAVLNFGPPDVGCDVSPILRHGVGGSTIGLELETEGVQGVLEVHGPTSEPSSWGSHQAGLGPDPGIPP